MNNFCRGSKYTEMKINLKRLHHRWRQLWKKWKVKARRRTNLPIPSTEAVFYKLENNLKWTKKLTNRENNPLENFSSEAICTFMNWRLFLASFRVVFWTKCAWRWASMSRENGIFGPDKWRRFHRLSEGEYLYGIPLQGQEFCWEIKVNLVIGNANVFSMWEQITEAMCYNLCSNANVLS